jgi:WD40 repeat protein
MNLGKSFSVAFAPDGSALATTTEDEVAVWTIDGVSSPAGPRCTAQVLHPSSVVFSPDSEQLLVKTTGGQLFLFPAVDLDPTVALQDLGGEGAPPTFSPCGEFIVDGSWDGAISVIRVSSGDRSWATTYPGDMICNLLTYADSQYWMAHHSPKATTEDRPPEPDYFTIWQYPHSDFPVGIVNPGLQFVRACAASPDGERLALVHGAPPDTVSIVDRGGVGRARTRIKPGGSGLNVTWSPSGSYLANVQDDQVVLFDEDLNELSSWAVPYPSDVAFAPDGSRIAIGSWEEGFVVEVETGRTGV